MSDTDAPDRLTRARLRADHATKLLDHAQKPRATTADLCVALAEHTRSMRELFDATMEAHPPKRAVYVADGDGYRRLRTISRSRGETGLVAALDRLRDFAGTEQDVRLVAERLRELGSYEVAASLLRNVEAEQ